ncbi:MAG TPA: helix-turn-helix domain-containing protein, partial [Mycobacterium sp.]
MTRAQIVLAAAAGESNAQIARWLRICEDTVRKWRRRWCAAPGAASLADAKRSGRRPTFTAVQVARVKAMACTPPRDKGLPLSRWSWWIFITDPDFAVKAQRVLDLYDRTWDGTPLGRNDYVISADQKTSIQARCRCHPTLPAGKARQIRVNHDYDRCGAVAY